jgi:hypothetical protein
MADSIDRDDAPDALDDEAPRAVTYSFVAPSTEQLEALFATADKLGPARALAAKLGVSPPSKADITARIAARRADNNDRGPDRA